MIFFFVSPTQVMVESLSTQLTNFLALAMVPISDGLVG
jgi:hypothetical protein